MRHRHIGRFFRGSIVAAMAAAAATLVASGAASAQTAHITTDGTKGDAVSFTGTGVVIDSILGTLTGGNLFHSFGIFNIPTGYSAEFTDTTASSIDNVISRVTGLRLEVRSSSLRRFAIPSVVSKVRPR